MKIKDVEDVQNLIRAWEHYDWKGMYVEEKLDLLVRAVYELVNYIEERED